MDRKPWTRRHYLYGMFAGICLGALLATVFFSITQDQMYVLLIPLGFVIGIGIGAVRTLIERSAQRDNS